MTTRNMACPNCRGEATVVKDGHVEPCPECVCPHCGGSGLKTWPDRQETVSELIELANTVEANGHPHCAKVMKDAANLLRRDQLEACTDCGRPRHEWDASMRGRSDRCPACRNKRSGPTATEFAEAVRAMRSDPEHLISAMQSLFDLLVRHDDAVAACIQEEVVGK